MIDWLAFIQVAVAALTGASVVVLFYAVGLRLLVRGGRAPVVAPAEFTDAIAIVSAKEIRRAEKAAAKAARKNPLSEFEKRVARLGAYACFGVCAVAVLAGLILIVVGH